MKFDEKVLTALEVLTDAAENDFELFRICTLVRDLISPPVVEQVDEKHQRFNGVKYCMTKHGYYNRHSFIHIDAWRYYNGDIPETGFDVHHNDWNPENNAPSNLVLLTYEEHRAIHSRANHVAMRAGRLLKNFVCDNCGREFTRINTGNNRFCSIKCREEFKKKHPSFRFHCEYCGKEFETNSRYARFCSSSCASKSKGTVTMYHKTCPICGKEFDVPATRKHQMCCSKECGAKHRAEVLQSAPITLTCPICGKQFETPRRKPRKTCSKECGSKLGGITRNKKCKKF